MKVPKRKPGWAELFVHYREAHRHPMTKLTHLLGIPLIVLAVPALLVSVKVAIGMFACGWALQFVGHYGFEKNDPQFFGDSRNLLVGVIWSAQEWTRIVRRVRGSLERRGRGGRA